MLLSLIKVEKTQNYKRFILILQPITLRISFILATLNTPASVLLQPSRATTATTSTPPFLSYSIPSTFSLNPFSNPQPSPPILPNPNQIPSIPFVQLPIFSKNSYLNSKDSNLRANVKIKVENINFYAHKEILGLASPFFEVLLNGGWSETEGIKKRREEREKVEREKVGKGKEKEKEASTDSGAGTVIDEDEVVESFRPIATEVNNELIDSNQTTLTTSTESNIIPKEQQKELEDTLSMTQSYMSSLIEESYSSEDEEEDDEEDGIICRLRLKEEKATSFQDLLCYIYPRTESLVTWVNVGDLCKMANKFDLPNLKNSCSAFLLPSAAGNPIKGMEIAEENRFPELYKEASRYLLDAYPNWPTIELAVLSPSTLLKLERRRSWYLERVLKLSQIQISRDYVCHSTCLDPMLCSKLVDEKWRSAWSSAFRFGTPQPSIIYRSLRSLEPSPLSPALYLPHTSCQAHACLWIADLFDRMFLLGIVPARSWGALTLNGISSAGGYGRTFGPGDNVAKSGGAKYFLSVDMD